MTRTALTLALALSLGLVAGCKSEPESAVGAEPLVDAGSQPTTFQVQGRVASPVLAGAKVALYLVTDEGVDWQNEISLSSTTANGSFSLTLDPEYLNMPAVLVVQDRPDETAIECILPAGCGPDTNFGSFHKLSESVLLRIGIPALSASAKFNATLLTELAFALAEAESKKAGAAGRGFSRLLTEANHRISSRFGIIGSLPSRPIANIADFKDVVATNKETIKYAAMGPAIVAAVLARYPEKSVPWAINYFVQQYTTVGVANRSNLPHLITFSHIYEHLLRLFKPYEQAAALTVLMSEFTALQMLALNDEIDRFDKGTVSKVTALSALDQAKAFVKQVRQVASSIDLKKIGSLGSLPEFVDGSASGALESFGVDVRIDQLNADGEMDVLTGVLKRILYTAMYALGEHYAGNSPASPYDGIHFNFLDLGGDRKELVFSGTTDGCPERENDCLVEMNLTLSGTFSRLGGNVSSQSVSAAGLDLKIWGSVAHGSLTMDLIDSQQRVSVGPLFYQKAEFEQAGWKHEEHTLEVENLNIRLPFRIAKASMDQPLAISGTFGAVTDIAKVGYGQRSRVQAMTSDTKEEVSETQFVVEQLHGLDITLGAMLDSLQDDTFVAGFDLKQGPNDPINAIMYSKNKVQTCSLIDYQCSTTEETSGFEGESESNFLDLTATAIFKANLKGIAEPVLVGLSGSRESHTQNKINHMKVTYPGHALVLDGEFHDNGGVVKLNAVNLEGFQMKLDSKTSGERYGSVTDFGGKSLAAIKDMGTWIKITFEDGDFESM